MIDPKHLLDHAESLFRKRSKGGAYKQVDLRRAISASYYALFHAILRESADLLIGKAHRKSAAYLIAYRSLDHKKLKRVCDELRRQILPERYRRISKEQTVGDHIKDVAFAAIKLQEWRYNAEYNPHGSFTFVDSLFTTSMARQAIKSLEHASRDQLRLLAALLFFDIRA
jgi:uncharacterized protein (UPF0332 family)